MTFQSPETSLALAGAEAVRFWREPRYDALECLKATFRKHRYALHTHETYVLAAVVAGCETFTYRGARHYMTLGQISVICPDELHDGEPEGEGFSYRTLYPSVELMRSVAEDVFGKPVRGTPHFAATMIEDPALAAGLAHLHETLEGPASLLERDAMLSAFLGWLLGAHAGLGPPPRVGQESGPVARARAYLDAHFAADVTLDDLAGVAGLNRSHLVRAFRKTLGTTPHAYQLDRRFRAARRLLHAGQTPATVAIACGFFDQSHLNRVFKARMGVTPGAFRGA